MAAKFPVNAPDDMPLLWVLRDILGMTGTKFGCGIAQCGACTVHVDSEPRRSCVTPIGQVVDREVTTIEGIGTTTAGRAVQRAWLDLEVVQCGYCQSGQIMSAAAIIGSIPEPTDKDIDQGMSGNICRCGNNEAPIIEVEVVKSNADPGGIGEPGTTSLAPAVLNAVYAATGVRMRKLPINSALLKA